jgi:capsular polysaccharide biosynthesis protein
MELREYWHILKRRWWIPVLLSLLVGLFSAVQLRIWEEKPPTYNASMRMLVGVLPAAEQDSSAYDPRYYAWLTSEYLVDDFTEVVRSGLFADNVSGRLSAEDIVVSPGVIQGSAATGKQHRIITLNFNWGDRTQLETIATASAAELTENSAFYFQQLGTDGAGVTLLDGPHVAEVGPSMRDQVDLPLRMVIAFLMGIGIVFLMDYMDTRVRGRKDLEDMGMAVVGEIPKHR